MFQGRRKKSLFYSKETRIREAQLSTQDDTDNEWRGGGAGMTPT